MLGAALAAYGLLTLLSPLTVARRLVTPQVVVPVGLLVFAAALADVLHHPMPVAGTAVAVLALLAYVARRSALPVLAWSAGAVAAFSWWWLAALGLDALDRLPAISWSQLWAGSPTAPGWALLVAALFLLLPLVVAPRSAALDAACGAGAAAALSGLVLVPGVDGSGTTLTSAVLAVTLGWLVAAHVAVRARQTTLSLVATVPAVLYAVPLAGVAATLLVIAAGRVLTDDPAARLPEASTGVHQLLLVPTALAVVAVAHLVLGTRHVGSPRTWVGVAGGTAVVALVATVALFAVPVWAVLVLVLAAAAGTAGAALRLRTPVGLLTMAAALGALLFALGIAAPDPVQLTVVTATVLLVAVATVLVGRFPGADVLGGALLPVAATGLLWSVADCYDARVSLLGVPTLLVVGALAIARPRVEVEGAAAVAALLTVPLVVAGSDHTATSAAIHLTVAGALVTISSLVHPSRRPLGWLGGALLLLATWVRLADLGVREPEAYTVPVALVLLGAGLWRLRRDPDATSATSLVPGLALLTVPSLLWVLAGDPVSLRALLLGLGCLGLVLGGAALRWSAPLTVGAAVGALLVLAELAPYVARTPQWVVLGSAGALLTVVGVTWEHRLADVRRASRMLARLR